MKASPAKSCPSCGERYDTDVLFCPRDGTPLASSRNPLSAGGADRDPYLGVELPGQIRLDHLIGIGSMGRVYRAFQGGIERDVAVKVLHRELSGNAELVARFHREAKVASRLVHPNVVQVLMTGALPHSADARTGGELYLVMEYLDGISLLSALAAAGTSGEGAALPLAARAPRRPPALRRRGRGARAGHRPPRHQARERDARAPRRRPRLREGARLRHRAPRLGRPRAWRRRRGSSSARRSTSRPRAPRGSRWARPPTCTRSPPCSTRCSRGERPSRATRPWRSSSSTPTRPPPTCASIARASYVPAPLAATIMANLVEEAGRARAERAAPRRGTWSRPRARAGSIRRRSRPSRRCSRRAASAR